VCQTSGPIGKEKGVMHNVPMEHIAGGDIHPLNKPITQRHNQLPFNQEIKSLQKPLDREDSPLLRSLPRGVFQIFSSLLK
jgi:hypothetical protein